MSRKYARLGDDSSSPDVAQEDPQKEARIHAQLRSHLLNHLHPERSKHHVQTHGSYSDTGGVGDMDEIHLAASALASSGTPDDSRAARSHTIRTRPRSSTAPKDSSDPLNQSIGSNSIPMHVLKSASVSRMAENGDTPHQATESTHQTTISPTTDESHRITTMSGTVMGQGLRSSRHPHHLLYNRRGSIELASSFNNVWTPGGHPRDDREAHLLIDLASSLAAYGAPLYRVEHRIINAAAALEIPVTFFSLPSTLMINIGDGGLLHPSRTVFISIVSNYDMYRLHQVDRLARRLGLIVMSYERAKLKMFRKNRLRESIIAIDPTDTVHANATHPFAGSAANPSTTPGTDLPTMHKERTDSEAEFDTNSRIRSTTSAHRGHRASIGSDVESFIKNPVYNRRDSEPVQVEEIIQELAELTKTQGGYSNALRIGASAGQSCFLALLLFKGSIADGIASCLLGALAASLQLIAEELQSPTAIIIFIAMTISFVARIGQTKYIWYMLSDSPYGLCHDTVSISALVQYLPGTQFTLAMLELGTDHSVAGAVRMFQAFMRSIMLGYGVSFGSRFGVFILQSISMWDQSEHIKACPSATAPKTIDWWRMPFFVPMTLSIMIFLKAHRNQWLHMCASSTVGFVVSVASGTFLSSDLSAALSAFCLGLVSNAWARYRDDIAIASVLAGIFWLVPGSVGIRGAIAAFSQDLSTSGTAFGVEIILRTLSIAVGLYTANAIMFPIGPRRRQLSEDDAMAV